MACRSRYDKPDETDASLTNKDSLYGETYGNAVCMGDSAPARERETISVEAGRREDACPHPHTQERTHRAGVRAEV